MKTELEIVSPAAWEMTTAGAAAQHSIEAFSADRLRPIPSTVDLMDDVEQKAQIEFSMHAATANFSSEEMRK